MSHCYQCGAPVPEIDDDSMDWKTGAIYMFALIGLFATCGFMCAVYDRFFN